jgi:hypothetical protein
VSARQPAWAKHFQRSWQERAGDPRLSLWLRVACLAYGHHLGNGHATFGPSEVRLSLSTVTKHGEVRPPASSDVTRAIRTAVRNGWLAEGSGARCLVVPGHAIEGGRGGVPTEHVPCPVHDTEQRARRHLCPVAA